MSCTVHSEEDAFKNSVECITGPISRIISTQGMPAVYEALDAHGKEVFKEVRASPSSSSSDALNPFSNFPIYA